MDGVVVAEVGVVLGGEWVAVHAGPAEGDEFGMAEVIVGGADGIGLLSSSIGFIGLAEAGGVVVEFLDDGARWRR